MIALHEIGGHRGWEGERHDIDLLSATAVGDIGEGVISLVLGMYTSDGLTAELACDKRSPGGAPLTRLRSGWGRTPDFLTDTNGILRWHEVKTQRIPRRICCPHCYVGAEALHDYLAIQDWTGVPVMLWFVLFDDTSSEARFTVRFISLNRFCLRAEPIQGRFGYRCRLSALRHEVSLGGTVGYESYKTQEAWVPHLGLCSGPDEDDRDIMERALRYESSVLCPFLGGLLT